MTDTFDDGKPIRLFESSAIMQYLVSTYDKDFKISFPPGTRDYYEMLGWLAFMNAGVGPMQGQSNHFTRYAPEKIQYGINRYQNETRRLYGVLEKHLKDSGNEYLVANKCTIAVRPLRDRVEQRHAVVRTRSANGFTIGRILRTGAG